ncbi:MAG: helicase, partial [Phycisphaerales bacterium]|nr:helicase [Phycisphaerales bacterium]
MTDEAKGRDLFIVDNSVSGWKTRRYLEEWCGIAKAFDIATGYFEIGALLALDGKWQPLEKIRILMGAEMTDRTGTALLDAVRERAVQTLDGSLEADKDANPFLNGVPAILEALRSGQIECRVYNKGKFHAKAYITHAKLEVIGSQALVGSSNFTKPGLETNIELNVQIQSAREVAQLQEWFEIHWNDARDVTDAVITTVARQTHLYTPFDVYAKALQEYFRGHELTDTEWDEGPSKMFPNLDLYQKEAYRALMKIARQHGGAFLCDGVGLGKTFVGLMLIERLVLKENKRVVLFAPKATKEGVWEPHLRRWLPHIGRVGGPFGTLAVYNHTDLGRAGDFPEYFREVTELADVVIIDEAHHFRNPGRQGNPDEEIEPSRYYQMFKLLDDAVRPKTLFMLTATPINNRLSDFRHMAELFTRRVEGYFAHTLGVNNLRAHFNQMEKALRKAVGHDVTDVAENMIEAQELLAKDEIFRNLVVQRSRAYARESQLRETGKAAVFPVRAAPQVVGYSVKKTYGPLLDLVAKAFERSSPLFTLPMYYPLAWLREGAKLDEGGTDKQQRAFADNRQKQVVGLIRTGFLKRFESSVVAFQLSCDRLLLKSLAFLEVHSETDSEKKRLSRWKTQNADILGFAAQQQLELWDQDADELGTEDIVPEELLQAVDHLDRKDYKVEDMMSETVLDLDQIVQFLEEARRFEPKRDDKLQKLVRLLKTRELS